MMLYYFHNSIDYEKQMSVGNKNINIHILTN